MSGIFAKKRLDFVAGLSDGILTALILGGGPLLHADSSMSWSLSLRVAAAAAIAGAFIFFVAHYADLRSELIRAERQLNLLSHGRFATTQLGKAVLRESLVSAVIDSVCTFIGALIPLSASLIPHGPRWLGAAVGIGALAVLGFFLGRAAYGSPVRWAVALTLAGVLVAYIGMNLKIV
jgi:predicted membrane protein (TIGR00267 family)|uniref:VIT family protein n=1 Tax=Desulfobacca acetoxidans TaxID=60893 RepID=A0A7V6A4H4_9BACT